MEVDRVKELFKTEPYYPDMNGVFHHIEMVNAFSGWISTEVSFRKKYEAFVFKAKKRVSPGCIFSSLYLPP